MELFQDVLEKGLVGGGVGLIVGVILMIVRAKRKPRAAIIGIVVVVLSLVSLQYAWDQLKTSYEPGHFTENFRSNFITGCSTPCVEKGYLLDECDSYCSCTLVELSKVLNYNDMKAISRGSASEAIMTVVHETQQMCLKPLLYAAGETCIKGSTELNGLLKRETHPGRPNYESVEKGDEPETGFYLYLDAPVCIEGFGEGVFIESDIMKLQLVIVDDRFWPVLREAMDTKVTVIGEPYVGLTGHYHARGALEVTDIRIR